MIPSGVSTLVGSSTPPAAPGGAVASVCYAMGGCSFSELSFLTVTLTMWAQQNDCSLVANKTVENWAFAARTATTMTWSGTSGSATYDGTAARWTYTSTADGFDTSGAGALCLGSLGPFFSSHSCTHAEFSRQFNGEMRTLCVIELMRNDCIPSVAV
jgi:hypothetical protein